MFEIHYNFQLNRDLLDKIKNFENEFIIGKKSNYQAPRLEPVNDTGGANLLREVNFILNI